MLGSSKGVNSFNFSRLPFLFKQSTGDSNSLVDHRDDPDVPFNEE
jgi:hypothetical protein